MKYLKEYDQINELLRNEKLARYYARQIGEELKKYGLTNKYGADTVSHTFDKTEVTHLQLNLEYGNKSAQDRIKNQKYINKNNIRKVLNKFRERMIKADLILGYFDVTSADMFNVSIKNIYNQRIKVPRYVYHATNQEPYEKIKETGLIPTASFDGNYKSEGNISYPPMIFAVLHGGVTGWGRFIIKIDTQDLPNKWWKDLNWGNKEIENSLGYVMTNEPIPLSHLTFIGKV